MTLETEVIKHREIGFREPHPEPDQAQHALLLLSDVEGILTLRLIDPLRIGIAYDIRMMTLQDIESALVEVGFHIDNSLLYKLQRALYAYTESTLRANLGLAAETCNGDCALKIFVRQYQNRSHGCRDIRPQHWRRYL